MIPVAELRGADAQSCLPRPLSSPGIDPPKAPSSFAIPFGGAEKSSAPCSRRPARYAHVVVVGRADVHRQVGGRAQPVPAAEGVASPRRQRVGASVRQQPPRKCRKTAGRTRSARWRPPWRPAAPREAVTAPRRALATLVSTSSGVILAAMSRECWPTTVLRP